MTVKRHQRTATDVVRENPLKIAAATIASIGIIAGAIVAVDSRYAHAGDIRQLSAQLDANRLTAELAVLEIRRSSLQDKVYEGRARRSQNRAEIEILDRYTRELADLERQIQDKRRALEGRPRMIAQ
jgi:hypothetical protein